MPGYPPTDEARNAHQRWLDLLTNFPFLYLPIVAGLAIACALIVPYLRGVAR